MRQTRDVCTNDACIQQAYLTRLIEIELPQTPQAEQPAEPAIGPEPAGSPLEKIAAKPPQAEAPPVTVAPQPDTGAVSASAAAPAGSYAATPAPAQFPQAEAESSPDGAKADRIILKVVLVLLILNVVLAIYLHRKGSLTIYQDYTDATFRASPRSWRWGSICWPPSSNCRTTPTRPFR